MTLLRTGLVIGAVLLTAPSAWAQSAQAIAARAVTPEEQAYVAEHYAEEAAAQAERVISQLRPLSATMRAAFPESVHADIDAAFAAYLESQRPFLKADVLRAMTETMTLEEMQGVGLNTQRVREITQAAYTLMLPRGEQLGLDSIRHVCSVVQDRAPEQCRALLERADEMEAQRGG